MNNRSTTTKTANIVVIGAGRWSQGWHLRHLSRNDKVTIVAIVDGWTHPKSNLEPNLETLAQLSARYKCPTYNSFPALPAKVRVEVDGVIVCTPHWTHYQIARQLFEEKRNRKKPLHILMESPFTTDAEDARLLHELVAFDSSGGCFLLNHTANYQPATKVARDHINSIGEVRHVSAAMHSPLFWLFDDPLNTEWTSPQPHLNMIGNGFAWGQSSHILAWIYHVLPNILPQQVFCTMNHSPHSNADISHSATLLCNNNMNVSLSGTSLLPGHAHSHPPVGNKISIRIFGTKGCLLYEGDDQDFTSGQLELRFLDDNKTRVLYPQFHFEDTNPNGLGPDSLQTFINACLGQRVQDVGTSSDVGLKVVQTIHAMYKSHASQQVERIV